MSRLARMLAVALVALFAAGTIAHAAGITTMTVKMSLADAGGSPADCQGCSGNDGKAPLCEQVCVTPLVAVPPAALAAQPAGTCELAPVRLDAPAGRSGPPDPAPPRAIAPS